MWKLVAGINSWPVWRKHLALRGGRFEAPSGDRLLYLLLHRIGLMGPDEAVLDGCVKRGMVVADVGANIGLYTFDLARRIGETGKVHSFEPDPGLFGALQRNCAANGLANIQLYNVALGSHTEMKNLARSAFNSGDNRFAAEQTHKSVVSVPVQVVRLDDVLGCASLDFMKLDVQGWELHALKGMGRTLANSPSLRIFVEFWPHGLRSSGTEPTELLDFLTDLRFRLELVGKNGPEPMRRERLEPYMTGSRWTNILAIRS